MSRAIAVPDGFDPVPSATRAVSVDVATKPPSGVGVVGVPVYAGDGPLPAGLPTRGELAAAGFGCGPGESLRLPGVPATVLVGAGDPGSVTPAQVRDLAAAFAAASGEHTHLALHLEELDAGPDAFAAAVEGVLLARYRFTPLRAAGTPPVQSLTLIAASDADLDGRSAAARRGAVLARAGCIARDLANCPPAHLTAERLGQIAGDLGEAAGLLVEVFDRAQLLEMRCGGILGVNGASHDEPRMIMLTYAPTDAATGRLALVGKGIMYDSGGISLKPADGTHATMKNDMTGAGSILAAMLALPELGATTAVTAYLMCTDNMPGGSALRMGDVITARDGTTVEVANTDAEGRLVMMDALVMAAETRPDAIIDVATLTGASMRALGTLVASVMGNSQDVVDQVRAASQRTDERTWQLPLERAYRPQLDSTVADISNLGGPNAGAITAALFLDTFVQGTPWAHIDIAGTAMADPAGSWRPPGCTGYGARLVAELAVAFQPPAD